MASKGIHRTFILIDHGHGIILIHHGHGGILLHHGQGVTALPCALRRRLTLRILDLEWEWKECGVADGGRRKNSEYRNRRLAAKIENIGTDASLTIYKRDIG
jgi:hypothetical protein